MPTPILRISKAWPLHLGLSALLIGHGALAFAAATESIQITTPKLPPRQATAQTNTGPAPAAPSNTGYGAQPAYASQGQQGFAPQAQPSNGQAAPVFAGSNGPAPTRAAAGGPCRVDVSPDRQALTLLGTADALPRHFLALGEFRVQLVIQSPDGRWAVAFLKLRGQSQFAMLTIDLSSCKEQRTVDLAQAGEDARFEGDNVIVRFGGQEKQWPLADRRQP